MQRLAREVARSWRSSLRQLGAIVAGREKTISCLQADRPLAQ
jgi:hypothetical protein